MPLRHQDTKMHKELYFNLIILVKLRVFEPLWQKKTFRSGLNNLIISNLKLKEKKEYSLVRRFFGHQADFISIYDAYNLPSKHLNYIQCFLLIPILILWVAPETVKYPYRV